MTTFIAWLRQQPLTNDRRGDFIKAACVDPRFPADAKDWRYIREWIFHRGTYSLEKEAAHQLWYEYRRSLSTR
jgi:uncharacterized protein YozE (UPF0346 family)